MKISAETIQKAYPDIEPIPMPKGTFKYGPNDFCVGGLICTYYFEHITLEPMRPYHFPTNEQLGMILTRMNHKLDIQTAIEYATQLTTYNDRGLTEEAWLTFSEALTYGNHNVEK